MKFGSRYASAYDALYRDKDYPTEAAFTLGKLRQLGLPPNSRMLDLGCGTGLHAIELAKADHTICGVDFSLDMLRHAEERIATLPPDLRSRLEFIQGDIRSLRLDRSFDAVISLFHVMSYMASDEHLDRALATARRHLRYGGALLFDFWYGPAVIANPPRARERTTTDGSRRIRRVTHPEWQRERDLVAIQFDIDETDISTGTVTTVHEHHLVRYFFEDDLTERLGRAAFQAVEFGEWLTGAAPSKDSFGVYVLARAT